MRGRFNFFLLLMAMSSVGTITSSPAQAQLLDPCPFTGDGDCDEPNGLNLCAWGTDANDCSNPGANYGAGAGFAAGIYGGGATTPAPTPTTACPYNNDGDCDEPNGLNLCAWGTDANDCSNPGANYGAGAGFAAGIYGGGAAPARPPSPPVANPGVGVIGGGSGGSFVNSGRGGSFGCPNFATQSTAFGQATVMAGSAVNGLRVPRITAGGRYALADCFPGTGWRGFTITRPDYRLFYQGNSPTGRLTFSLVSGATDTVLLINTPDGQWHFNDDANGSFNSALTFAPAMQGQYDIWAGSYNYSSNNPAELYISE